MGGTGLEPVTPSLSSPQSCYAPLAGTPSLSRLCRNPRTLPAAAFALVLGLRPPLQLAPVSTARPRQALGEKPARPPQLPGRAAVAANRSHRRRRVVEFCHSGGGIWTDINDPADVADRPVAAHPRQHDLQLLLRRPAAVLPLLTQPSLLVGRAVHAEPDAGQPLRELRPSEPVRHKSATRQHGSGERSILTEFLTGAP